MHDLSRRARAATFVLFALASSCVDQPSSPEGGGEERASSTVSLALAPSWAPAAAGAQAQPINRIRAVATRVSDGAVLGSTVLDVDPAAAAWDVGIDVEVPPGGVQVVVTFELIHVDGSGAETVEFSGQTAPLTVQPSTTPRPEPVVIVRGPLENLGVTSVTIDEPVPALVEGGSETLTATVETTDGAAATVFWTSLAPDLASFTGATLTAHLPGVVAVVATAGPVADTVEVVVAALPAAVEVDPDTLHVGGTGGEVTVHARVLDPRGDAIVGQPVLWRSLTPGVIESLGGGLFSVLAAGEGWVEARAAADTLLKDTAVVVVEEVLADLRVSKSAGTSQAQEGDEVTFTLDVTNLGPAAAAGVAVVDSLPTGLALVSASPGTGSFDPATRTWAVGVLGSGQSATLTLVAEVEAGTAGRTLSNVAKVAALTGAVDPVAANDRAVASVSVKQPRADLGVAKAVAPQTGLPGDTVTFTVEVANLGPDLATGVAVVDSLPAGLGFVSADAGQGTFGPATGTWAVGALAAGQTRTLTLKAVIQPGTNGQVLTNVARSLGASQTVDAGPLNDRAVADVSVGVQPAAAYADLEMIKSVSPTAADEGDTVTYLIELTNLGPDTANALVLADTLPAGLVMVDLAASQGTVDPVAGTVTLSALPPLGQVVVTLQAEVQPGTAGSTLVNSVDRPALTSELDTVPANDTAAAALDVNAIPTADLIMFKSASNATPDAGDTITFSLSVLNSGPDAAPAVSVQELFPAGLVLLSHTGGAAFDPGTGVWTVGSLAAGATAPLDIVAEVPSGTAGTVQTNTAFVTGTGGPVDPDAANDTATVDVGVGVPAVNLSVTKAAAQTVVGEAQTAAFNVTVENTSSKTATNVVVRDSLSAGLAFDSAVVTGGVFDGATGAWTLSSLPAGASEALTLYATVAVGQNGQVVTNDAWVQSLDQVDTLAADDAAADAVTVPGADVQVQKTVNDPAPLVGDTVTFTVTVTNHSVVPVSDVRVRDTLPAGLTFVSSAVSAGSVVGDTLWTLPAVAAGASATWTLAAEVDPGTSGTAISNEAQRVFTVQTDTFPSNDADQASVSVGATPLNLTLASGGGPSPVGEGQSATFVVSLANTSTTDATNVVVRDSLGVGLTYDSASVSGGGFSGATGTWTVPSLPAGSSLSLTVSTTVQVGQNGQTPGNHAWIVSLDQADTLAADDTTQASVAVPGVDVQVQKAVNDPAPAEGDTVTFTVTVTNNGVVPVDDVVVLDTVPAGMTVVAGSSQATLGAVVGDSLWTISQLNDGGQAQWLFDATLDAGTGNSTLVNEAQRLSTVQTDTFPSNDAATVDLNVQPAPVGPFPTSFRTPGNTELVTGGYPTPPTPHASDTGNALSGSSGVTVTNTGTSATLLGGSVDLQADGDFSYRPPRDASFASDSFWVHVQTGDSAAIEVVLDTLVWYLNDQAGPGGDGTSAAPYSQVLQIDTASLDDEVIYVHRGSGTPYAPQGLRNGQRLVGEAVALVVAGDTLAPAGGDALRPIIGTGTFTGLSLANGNHVTGVAVDGGGSVGIRASAVADGLIEDVHVLGGDDAITLPSTTGLWRIDGLRILASDNWGVSINSGSGTYTFTDLHIEGTAAEAINITGGTPTIDMQLAASTIVSDTLTGGPLTISTVAGGSITIAGGRIEGHGSAGIFMAEVDADVTIHSPVVLTNTSTTALALNTYSGNITLDTVDVRNANNEAALTTTFGVGTLTLGSGVLEATSLSGVRGIWADNSAVNSTLDTVRVVNTGGGWSPLHLENHTGTFEATYLEARTVNDSAAILMVDAGTLRATDPTSHVVAVGATAIDVTSGGTLDLVLDSLHSSNSGGRGVSLVSAAGGLTVNGGTVSGSTNESFYMDGFSSADVTFGADIVHSAPGFRSVIADNRPAGTLEFTGSITDTGRGIQLTSNQTGTVTRFSGPVDVDAQPGNNALLFGGSGTPTLEVTGSGSTLNTSGAVSLAINQADIGPAGVTFQAVSGDAASTPSIQLTNMSGTGTVAVTGTGTAGSGGVISNNGQNAVLIQNNTVPVSLSHMDLVDPQDAGVAVGISGVTAGALTFDGLRITGYGQGTGGADGMFFSQASDVTITNTTISDPGPIIGPNSPVNAGIETSNLNGTLTLSNVAIVGSEDSHVRVVQSSGVVSVVATQLDLDSLSSIATEALFEILPSGPASVDVEIASSEFDGGDIAAVRAMTSGTSTLALLAQNSDFGATSPNDIDVYLFQDGDSDIQYQLTNNTFRGLSRGVEVMTGSAATGIQNAQLSLNRYLQSGLGGSPTAINVDIDGGVEAFYLMQSDTIQSDSMGIAVDVGGVQSPDTASMDFTILDSRVDADLFDTGNDALSVQVWNAEDQTCVDIADNTFTTGAGTDIFLRPFQLGGFMTLDSFPAALNINSSADIQTYLTSATYQGNTASSILTNQGQGAYQDGVCTLPP